MSLLAAAAVESDNVLADLARVLFVFVPGAIIIGSVLLVLIAYFKAWRIDKFKGARAGLLPSHVWTIALSYTLLIIDEILVVFSRKNEGFTIHSFLLIPAFAFGIYAMITVLRFERRRYSLTKTINSDIDDPSAVAMRLPDDSA